MSFLHGVETIEYQVGPTVVETVATAVIGIVGTAPIQTVDTANRTVNVPQLIATDKDAAAYFGKDTDGYSIPRALTALLAQGAGPFLVVNVFDPSLAAHQTAGGVPDPSLVTAADIIGATTTAGKRTGLLAFLDAKSIYGYGPKQIIAPGFSTLTGVPAQMLVVAAKLRAIAWIDTASGLSYSQAIALRSSAPYNSSSKRLMICYPLVKAVDGDGDEKLYNLSTYAAGACAAKDNKKGYWYSPSNTELSDVTGLERPIDGTFQDTTSELNLLNAAGIVTIMTGYGMGYRIWGNRSAAYPASSDPDTFVSIRRTADIIEEALEKVSLEYADQPITPALRDQILDDANAFLRSLQWKGAIVGGKAFYDSSKNSSSELANGHLVVGYRFMPPAPLERLTFESYLDINLYESALK